MFNALAISSKYALTLVMPVYGEGVRVIPAIATLAFTVKVPLKLLVVYDSDEDPTLRVIEDMRSEFPAITPVRNRYRRAIGAIKTGFEENSSDIVGVWVSYHVDPYGLVNRMYELASTGGCQIVSGNRFNMVKRFSRGNLLKKLLSRGGNFILNRIIGMPIGDITTSVKLYRKEFLEANPIETTQSGGWALSSELAVKAAISGVKMGEVEFGHENINMINGVSNFRVFNQLDQYIKWLNYGWRNRKIIVRNYQLPGRYEN